MATPTQHEPSLNQPEASDRRLAAATAANVLLTAAQTVGGLLGGSVALVADALHNLNDAAALAIVLVARRISRRSADPSRTFGYHRARVVGALVNLTALAVVALFLVAESVRRALEPRPVDGWIMIALAGTALAVDVVTVLMLSGMRRGGVDARAAFVHNLSDALASVAVLLGGVAVLTLGWTWVDPLLSLLIVAYVLAQVARMAPGTIRVLMESAPPGLDIAEVAAAMQEVAGVRHAHHLHAWLLDERRCALEAHLVVAPHDAGRINDISRRVRALVQERFGIAHATLEVELESANGEAGTAALLADEGPGADQGR